MIPGNSIFFFLRTSIGSAITFKYSKKLKYISFLDYKYSRSPGTFCILTLKNTEKNIVKIKLKSGVTKKFKLQTSFLCGRISNKSSKNIIKKKASYQGKFKKPIVRGVAMNPVDHPHGGRTKTNKPEVSKWGWIAKHSH